MFRVLSIDGGGIKGIFPVSFLSAIEATTGKSVGEHFDLIAGTSTGGIIALGLGLGFTPAELLAFYREEGKAIFPGADRFSRAARWTRQLLRVAYSPRALEAALRNRPELFVGTLTEKLLTFALGRGMETCDAPAVRQIVRQAQAQDYHFSSIILGIVNSTPFTMRRAL